MIERGRRRVPCAGGTEHPTAEWVAQPARQLTGTLPDEPRSRRCLIHDRAAKFPASCDRIFAAEDSAIVRTPDRTPTANALAERGVRSVREEALDQLFIVNQAHWRRVLSE